MTEPHALRPIQAEEIARAFNEEQVDYLIIGKSGAILLGYPGHDSGCGYFSRALSREWQTNCESAPPDRV